MKVIGLMSGTSADGVDAALCEITGEPPQLHAEILHAVTIPYMSDMRQRILNACQPETSHVDELCQLNFDLAETFVATIQTLIDQSGVSVSEIDLIGSHGQSVWHNVLADGSVSATLQIVEASVIAEGLGVTTISNFRTRDVAAGGQGAPLTGYVDWLLLRHETKWRAVQNIGGMGNVTLLPPLTVADREPLAFDTGPGNALIDMAVVKLTDNAQTYDIGGALARQGRIDEEWLEILLSHPYYHRQPPKTTGRELFGTDMAYKLVNEGLNRGLTPAEIVATVTTLTAQSIADAYRNFIDVKIDEIILGGGGRHNAALVGLLSELLAPVPVMTHEDIGIDSDFKEALVFAVLAYETWHNRPSTLSKLTGARHPTVLGQITPGANYADLSKRTWSDS
jgi:anhydro-N-acetylmuramic acid kinase